MPSVINNKFKMKKTELHERNKHNSEYDFDKLTFSYPALKKYVKRNKFGNDSVDFFDSQAVIALNKALLISDYGMTYWSIPSLSLCPPIPGRADYIHYVSDLIGNEKKNIKCLDIGVGASCIYPIIGCVEYDWEFIGSDIDIDSLENAQKIVDNNPILKNKIKLRLQNDSSKIFEGVIARNDFFDVVICNPPFHNSQSSANKAGIRKLQNLKKCNVDQLDLNFGGKSNELWCDGGELKFLLSMITESKLYRNNCYWFTSLVSKESNLDLLCRKLNSMSVLEYGVINMQQGNKISRILAWRY